MASLDSLTKPCDIIHMKVFHQHISQMMSSGNRPGVYIQRKSDAFIILGNENISDQVWGTK